MKIRKITSFVLLFQIIYIIQLVYTFQERESTTTFNIFDYLDWIANFILFGLILIFLIILFFNQELESPSISKFSTVAYFLTGFAFLLETFLYLRIYVIRFSSGLELTKEDPELSILRYFDLPYVLIVVSFFLLVFLLFMFNVKHRNSLSIILHILAFICYAETILYVINIPNDIKNSNNLFDSLNSILSLIYFASLGILFIILRKQQKSKLTNDNLQLEST